MVSERKRSSQVMVDRVMSDPQLVESIQRDTVAELQKLSDRVSKDVPRVPVFQKDYLIYRIVVGGLAAVLIITVIGFIVLALNKVPLPDGLVAVGSAAGGALAGLLAPTPMQDNK